MTVTLEGSPVAVVTGVREGIGLAVARALAAAGARVAVTHHDAATCTAVARGLGAEHAGVVLDLRSRTSIEQAAEEITRTLGVPAILVNNAGINRIAPALEITEADWRDVLEVNLTGAFAACQVFGGLMLEAGHGSIVNIGSIVGARIGMPGRAPYAASKAGVLGFTRILAVEWASRGVRVNFVQPGPVLTPMVERAIEDGIIDPAAVVGRTPAGRFGHPEDVARAVLLLVSEEGAFTTGQTLVVDGGYVTYGAAGPLPGPSPPD